MNIDPFEVIDKRLSNIELMLLDLKHNPNNNEIPKFFGIDVCEEITGIAKATIYRNTSKNLMPHYRRDGKLLFSREEIYAWMTEKKVKTRIEQLEEMDCKLTKIKKGKA